eukprot:2818602-Rhodomonas_salina.2
MERLCTGQWQVTSALSSATSPIVSPFWNSASSSSSSLEYDCRTSDSSELAHVMTPPHHVDVPECASTPGSHLPPSKTSKRLGSTSV